METLQWAMAKESGEPLENIKEKAAEILREMAHNLQLCCIRFLAYTLSKVLKRVYHRIMVNEEGMNRLREAMQEHPVILLPNHRCYADFLVLSYILFTYDLSIPVIAAGRALMGMRLMGEVLRRSGAFYIGRGIRADKLYWAVLSEYVHTIVRTGHAPVEFYVEGWRSRTLKSLNPKLGMMQMVLDPFFKGEVYDVSLVPISISYERVLEESLLAHELLGFPKPKESTLGLLKALYFLEGHYGSIHLRFGQPISVRELFKSRITYKSGPRNMPPEGGEEAFVRVLAHEVVRLQERGMVVSPWSLVALILLQNPEGLDLDMLTKRTTWLRDLVLKFGAHLDWPGHMSVEDVMSSSLSLHQSVVCCEEGRVQLLEEEGPGDEGAVTPETGVFRRAVIRLMCASYRNQAMHVFVRPTLVIMAMASVPSSKKEDVLERFKFLQELFAGEFVFVPGMSVQDFDEACSQLERCGVLQTSDQKVVLMDDDTAKFLQTIIQPFIQTYQAVFHHLIEDTTLVFTEGQYVTAVRSFCLKLILDGELQTYEALSSDMLKNALHALVRMGAVSKTKVGDQNEFRVNKTATQSIGDSLGTRPSIN
ncbi:dihydroxyacetone phosphate acyltransferase-like isoform X2 [Engraulis encrasicolus]|uniref:dihydroxyacetone phosphate acyltransferase-like isoform X2 n=1 Tax=Engraulis encrasicolus TaxID=184585 RepID=UPI002FCEEDDB